MRAALILVLLFLAGAARADDAPALPSKAERYLRNEYLQAMLPARQAIVYDGCVSAGFIIDPSLSAQARFSDYVEHEKNKNDPKRPSDVTDIQVGESVRQALRDAQALFMKTPFPYDQGHCAIIKRAWPQLAKQYYLE